MTSPWRNRIVGTGDEAPDQLVANPANWRTHPGPQRDALRGSLAEVGWVQQVMVNQRTGFVVDGHARVEEALSRHEPTVPVLYVDLTPEEEAIVLATLDPIGAMAQRDDARLQELLSGLVVDDAGLAALLADLAPQGPKPGLTDPDDVPPLGEESNVHLGDLFALGDHRLMCGDSTKAEDVARLSASPADCLWADPPYGVGYVGKTVDALTIDNDDANAAALVRAAFEVALTFVTPRSSGSRTSSSSVTLTTTSSTSRSSTAMPPARVDQAEALMRERAGSVTPSRRASSPSIGPGDRLSIRP